MTLHAKSLRNKILLFAAALVLVPGVVFGVIAERSGRDSLKKVIGRQLAREAGHVADRLSSVLFAERETLQSFARQDLMREIRVGDIDKRVSQALATLREGSPARVDYLVVGEGGRTVASSHPRFIGAAPPWGHATPAADGIAGPVAALESPGRRLTMTTAIPDPDDPGRVLGTLVGVFDWELLTAVTADVGRDLAAQGIAADVLIAGPEGRIIGGARSPGSPERASPAVWSDLARNGLGEAPDYRAEAGAGLLVGRASLAAGLPGWKVLVVEPLAHALAPARRLTKRLVVALGLALTASLVLATLAARRVLRPLSELTEAIRGLSRGDSGNLRVPVRSEDEVGTLAAAFNHMASELDRVQRDLVEAEKFAFVGELASGVAHEVRTSLGVLRSSAQIVERSLPADAGAQTIELAQMIRTEVDRLTGVVNDLLTLDRPRPLHLEPTPISLPVFQAVDFVEPRAREKGIHITRTKPTTDPLVRCDREMLHQVAVNLLVNAIDALEPGGRVQVRVLAPEAGATGFEVEDDGPGIPSELRDKVFRPFVTARPGGVGLGLTYVKRVVHDHRGRVAVVDGSEPGTCIRIELPVASLATGAER